MRIWTIRKYPKVDAITHLGSFDNTAYFLDVRIAEKNCQVFEFEGLTFKILPKRVNFYTGKLEKIYNDQPYKYNTILVLCQNDEWVYVANALSETNFREYVAKLFEPGTLNYHITQTLKMLYTPVIKP